MRRLLCRVRPPSPALIISMVALTVALGGTAWAAIHANSVGSLQVKNNSLKSIDLKDHRAVKDVDVVSNSLTGNAINEGTLGVVPNATHASSADSATSADTATNAGHATTADSATTAAKLANLTVSRADFTVANGVDNGITATCPAGQQVITGGVRNDDVDTDGYVELSRPVLDGTEGPTNGQGFDGWRGFVFNQTDAESGQAFGANTLQATVWAVCAG